MSNKAKFWIGVLLAIPAIVLGSVISGAGSAVVDAVNGDPAVGAAVSGVLGLLILAAFIAAIVIPRTRWFALGILAGTAVLFILAAGACVALIVAYSNSSDRWHRQRASTGSADRRFVGRTGAVGGWARL